MKGSDQSAIRKYRSWVSNIQGGNFEKFIMAGCDYYSNNGIAKVIKVPEPFKVLKKLGQGKFMGIFTALAEPDFQGTYFGGLSLAFEAKRTEKDRIMQNAVTKAQATSLEAHYQMGAITFVLIDLDDKCFNIPWEVWRDMKKYFGRKYILPNEIESFRVRFDGTVKFLDFVHKSWIKEGMYQKGRCIV